MNLPSILHGLNPAQEAAVTSQASVLQVLAPPGSGKTKTLTARVAHLIANHGLEPRNIIVCTFTNKAAREMGERISIYLGKEYARKLVLGTFHSISCRLLKQHGKHLGLSSDFGIADTSDTKAIITRILKKLNSTVPPGAVLGRISKLKSQSITSERFLATNKNVEQQEFSQIYIRYEDHLRISNLLDFDDLILRCAELLRRFPGCVSHIQAVLIDEFQDTNSVQYELMELFSQARGNVTIVGDPDQSIYGWRNAEIKNLNKMKQSYSDVHVINLEENYRSSGAILIAAQEVIEQDQSRPPKRLAATHSIGVQPVLRKLPSAHAEASWLVSEIQRTAVLAGGLLDWSDYAVLLRSASLSRLVETTLGKSGIPYRMVGGHRFFDRVEVKLILDYLRVISLPSHNGAVARVINVPARGIGEKTLQYLLEEAEEDKVTIWDVISRSVQGRKKTRTQLSKQAEQGIATFFNIIVKAQSRLKKLVTVDNTLADFLQYLIKKIDLRKHIKAISKQEQEEFESRWANVEELVAQAAEFSTDADLSDSAFGDEQASQNNDDLSGEAQYSLEQILLGFLGNVALATDATVNNDSGPPKPQITLSTIHAAKGLEWPVVFIPSAYEGSIPHSRAEDNDEERRLLYVAMTRAQSLLYLSCPTRNTNKENTTLSPFLTSIRTDAYFAKRGPELKYEDIKQIGAILHRSCPIPAIIESIPATLEFPKDNQWPLSGESREERKSWEMGASIDGIEQGRFDREKSNFGPDII